MRTGNNSHESWDATPYQPDPPAITEAEAAEQRKLRMATIAAWVMTLAIAAAFGLGAAWARLTVKPF